VASLSSPQQALLRSLAARIVPAAAALGTAEQAEMMHLIAEALSDRTPEVRRQFAAFLTLVRWAPAARYGRPFDALAPERQDAVLRYLQDCPVQLLRAGFWGVRTLILMGFYARPAAGATFGYTPVLDGNAVIHAADQR